MVEEPEGLRIARRLLSAASEKAKSAKNFTSRWKSIVSKLERLNPSLSDLSSHPFFPKNSLCGELISSTCEILEEVVVLAENCGGGVAAPPVGKLQMQSDLDTLAGKLELILRDCEVLIKIGILKEEDDPERSSPSDLQLLLRKIQIGDSEAKHRAYDDLLEAMREDSGSVAAALGRSNISTLVQQLNAPSPKLREKAASVVCFLAESRRCDGIMVAEGVLPPLIKLAESASLGCREKAAISLEKLSNTASAAREIIGHGGIRALLSICRETHSPSRLSSAAALRNISAIAELRQELASEGAIKLAIDLLNDGEIEHGMQKLAAEWLRNFTDGEESLTSMVAAEGGTRALLHYLERPPPEEPAIIALKNLVGVVSEEEMLFMGLLPQLAHALRNGSLEARAAAASTIYRVCNSPTAKKSAGSHGSLPFLISMLDSKAGWAREAAAEALSRLITCSQNAREVKKDPRSVPSLVQLLDASPKNGAKKEAVLCLLLLSGSKKSRKMMVSYGAIGYLKKLSDAEYPGAKSLLQSLESSSWWTMKR